MGISSGCSAQNGLLSGKQFALVSYLPDPLAPFLDELCLELVPDCSPRAHVTILPPRPISGTPPEALHEIRELARLFEPFTLRLGNIARFPVSDVVYIEIANGREKLFEMFKSMNSGTLSYKEAYPYCPHITLAQRIQPKEAEAAFEAAERKWNTCPLSRSVPVETLYFVESDDGKCWRDLGEVTLKTRGPIPGAIRTTPAEPLYPA